MIKHDVALPVGLRPFCLREHRQVLGQLGYPGDAGGGGVGLGEHHEHAVEPHHAHQNHVEIGQEGQDDSGLGFPGVDPPRPDQHHQRQADVQKQRHDRARQGHRDPGPDVPLRRRIVDGLKAPHFIGFLREGLHHPDPGDVFPHDAHHVVHAPLHQVIKRDPLGGDEHHQGNHDGRHDAQDQGQPRVHRQCDGDAAHQHDRRADAQGLGGADKILHVIGVRRHPGDQGGQAHLVHLTAGQVQGLMKKIPPDLKGPLFGNPDRLSVGRHVQKTDHAGQQDHHPAPNDYLQDVFARHHVVQQMLHHIGNQQLQQRRPELDAHPPQDHPPVFFQVFPQKLHATLRRFPFSQPPPGRRFSASL